MKNLLLPMLLLAGLCARAQDAPLPTMPASPSACFSDLYLQLEDIFRADTLGYFAAIDRVDFFTGYVCTPDEYNRGELDSLKAYQNRLEKLLMAYNARIAKRMGALEQENASLRQDNTRLREELVAQKELFSTSIQRLVLYHAEEKLKAGQYEEASRLLQDAQAQGATNEALKEAIFRTPNLTGAIAQQLVTPLGASFLSDGDFLNIDLMKDMVRVAGGTFTMGCTDEQGRDCEGDEKPAHPILLSDYYIGKYEVTQALYERVMGENPSSNSDCPECPVERVSWNDAQAFLQKLNELTGETYRLPTEAEWEYAARGGASGRATKYAGSDDVGAVAWYDGNSGSTTHPVGQKQPNELGLYDMSGNVWEWCQDWYDDKYYKSSPTANPPGPASDSLRVIRGGSWDYDASFTRVSVRNAVSPEVRNRGLGFRLSKTITP